MPTDDVGFTVKVAVAQAPSKCGDPAHNLATVQDFAGRAAAQGVQLVVFPEAFLTGYVADSADEAAALAISATGSPLQALGTLAHVFGIYICVGYLEAANGSVYNAATLVGPGKQSWHYRKRHLPFLGADRFTQVGREDSPAVFHTPLGRIGIAICYEIRFPEVIRTLALGGAELVVLPTAWPTQSSMLAEHFTRVRAAENFVYLLAANRPDAERGVEFLGRSSITGPMGERLTEAGPGAELIVAVVDPTRTHDKRIIVEEGIFEVSPWSDRRPALYKSISTPGDRTQ